MKKIFLIMCITILLFCFYCPNYVAKEEIQNINFILNHPCLHSFNKQLSTKMVNFYERSGWPRIYDKGIEDFSSELTIDTQGNIIVTGYTGYYADDSTEVVDFLTIKYDSEGNEIWNVTFDSGTYDFAWDIISDSHDNIIVFGFNWTTQEDLEDLNIHFRVVKYNKDGVEQWNLTYHNGIDNLPGGIAVDSNDCIIISGGYGDINATDFSCWTLKMDSMGIEQWNQTFTEDMFSVGMDVTVDLNDNIIVGGMSASFFGQGYGIIKYDSNGNKISVHRYGGGMQQFDMPNAIAIDKNENIILTGQRNYQVSRALTWLTMKCDKFGNKLWTREYDSGEYDTAEDVSVDSNGNIITVGGSSFSEYSNYEHCAIIYDKNGNEICLKRPNIYGSISGVAVDNNDRIIITGSIQYANNWDYYTNIYSDITPPSVKLIKPETKSFYILNTKLFSLPKNTIIIGKLTISISSENPSDVTKVEFYINNKLKETLSAPPYAWVWSDRLFGRYTVKTMAYDESGNVKKYELNLWKFF